MILSCNSCEKKFVVPDNAIGKSGRLVQCSSCGNKWKQFPIAEKIKKTEKITPINPVPKKIKKSTTKSKRKVSRKSGPDLYSPEYLAKKHGIKISSIPAVKDKVNKDKKTKINFGFYYLTITWTVISIFTLRLLYFSQDLIIERLPASEVYLNYLFESIRNIKDIIENFILY